MIGRSIGSYTIVGKLGSGGMGEVYLAEHRRMGRRAAIKFLLPSLSRDPDVVSRFFNEARATSVIKHPGIVEIYDCDVVDDRAYIVMEYLEGESLAGALQRVGSYDREIASVASVAGQIASALAAAHAKGIIHRDLKPENVFLALDEAGGGPFTVRILDFGIAKLAGDGVIGAGPNTRTGSILGTPIYMPPEQCRGLSTIDHRADIYALGCIMFEMITGRHVFEKEAPGDLLVAHISEQPVRASSLKPGIPPALDDLIARMLAKDPGARPPSMAAVVSELEQLLGTKAAEFARKIPATGTMASGLSRRSLVSPSAPASGEEPKATTFRQAASELVPAPARGRRKATLLAALGLAAAAGAAILLTRHGHDAARRTDAETAAPGPVTPAATAPSAAPAEPTPRPIEAPAEKAAAPAPVEAEKLVPVEPAKPAGKKNRKETSRETTSRRRSTHASQKPSGEHPATKPDTGYFGVGD